MTLTNAQKLRIEDDYLGRSQTGGRTLTAEQIAVLHLLPIDEVRGYVSTLGDEAKESRLTVGAPWDSRVFEPYSERKKRREKNG